MMMSIVVWAQEAVFTHYISSDVDDWDRWFLGRAPRIRETLPDFRESCRVAQHSRVFRGLMGSKRTPRFWGVTHCKDITTLRSGKTIDKTNNLKDLPQEISKYLQNESKRDDDVIDEPNLPKADVVDVESGKDKAKHAPTAPYPHGLRVPKN